MLSAISLGLGKVGKWLFDNPAVLMTGIISVMFVMVVVSKNSEIAQLEKTGHGKDQRIETLITSLGQARSNVATLNSTLQTQSDSITDLQNQGIDAGHKFDALIVGMAAGNATTARKIDMLDKAKPGVDKCASAQELVKGSVL